MINENVCLVDSVQLRPHFAVAQCGILGVHQRPVYNSRAAFPRAEAGTVVAGGVVVEPVEGLVHVFEVESLTVVDCGGGHVVHVNAVPPFT